MKKVIFNEDEVWDGKLLRYSVNDIKELDEAIEVIEVPQSEEKEDIQIAENPEVDLATTIIRQANHKAENPETDHEMEDFNAEKNQEWTQNQYPTPDPSIFEAFLTNFIHISIQSQGVEDEYFADSTKSEVVVAEQSQDFLQQEVSVTPEQFLVPSHQTV